MHIARFPLAAILPNGKDIEVKVNAKDIHEDIFSNSNRKQQDNAERIQHRRLCSILGSRMHQAKEGAVLAWFLLQFIFTSLLCGGRN